MAIDPETFDSLLEAIERFVAERLVPLEAEVDRNDHVPDSLVGEMKDLGLFGLTIPEAYGGLGLGVEQEVRVAIALGHTSPAFRSIFGTNIGSAARES